MKALYRATKINRTDLGEPVNGSSWPQHTVKSVDCRKRDLVIRITNWLRDEDEPAVDVEVYNKGVYDWNESKSFTRHSGLTPSQARQSAIAFAKQQIAKFAKTL